VLSVCILSPSLGLKMTSTRSTREWYTEAILAHPNELISLSLQEQVVSPLLDGYHHPNGTFAGVVLIESNDLVNARMRVALSGTDGGLSFMPSKLHDDNAGQVPHRPAGGPRLLGPPSEARTQASQ
jgi:hypothetical protein